MSDPHDLVDARPASAGRVDVVVVPLGSTEQHGAHLPYDTDTVVASAVAQGIAEALRAGGSAASVAPALAFGASGEHQDFAGTISIGEEALRHVVVELQRSIATWAPRTVLVNGHGGNVRAVAGAVEQLRAEGHDIRWVPCAVAGADAHAGRTETSLLLHLAPARVDLGAASPGATAPIADLLPALRARGVRAVSPNGVLGDPTGASAAEGAELLRAMVAGALERLAAG